jgi:hypothetical protein
MDMLRFYARLARQVPALVRSSTSRATKLTAGFLALLTTFGPSLAQHGHGEIAELASALPRWWAPAWAAFFVALGLLKLNYALHSATETERDALKARLEDRRQRQADADELGRMRKTMRKRFYPSWTSSAPKCAATPGMTRNSNCGHQTRTCWDLMRDTLGSRADWTST